MYQSIVHVRYRECVGLETFLLVLDAPQVASEARPGQFVMVRCGELPLRRPISIHAASDDRIALLFRVAGTGTSWLSGIEQRGSLDLTGPLGNGYTVPSVGGRVVLVAGGMGIAPLCFLASRLAVSHEVIIVHGTRSAGELYEIPAALRQLVPAVRALENVTWLQATDDGSAGAFGSALDAALPYLEHAAQVYVCGPHDMCVAAHDFTSIDKDITFPASAMACSPRMRELLVSAEVSLEVRMGCGVGACYSCSIPTLRGRRKVCTDGPVFRFGDVLWEGICT